MTRPAAVVSPVGGLLEFVAQQFVVNCRCRASGPLGQLARVRIGREPLDLAADLDDVLGLTGDHLRAEAGARGVAAGRAGQV